MFTHRAAVAALGLPLLAALVLAPERLFAIGVTIVIALGAAEFIRVIPSRPSPTSIIASGAFAALLAMTLRTFYVPPWTLIGLVAVTAFAMKGDEQKIREGGCEAYISKPISVVSFLQTVDGFLKQEK